jgi:hypothetical protein
VKAARIRISRDFDQIAAPPAPPPPLPAASWFSFLRMPAAHIYVPALVALMATIALVPLTLSGSAPRTVLLVPSLAILAATFWGWMAAYRRLQALDDIPLSRIASAAQGYARLEGRAALFPGKPLRSPLTQQPCCWYSYRSITYDNEGQVKESEHETTDWSFMMTDGSGECVVDPAGARIVPLRVRRYKDKYQLWREEVILAGDPLTVIGDFTTSGQSTSESDIDFRTGELLAQWKRNMAELLRRFPPSQSSTWSEREWEEVRLAARRSVQHDAARETEGQNRIEKPRDGRPFLISAEPPEQLARDLLIWTWFHAVAFVCGVGVLAWLYVRYL